MIKIRLVGRRSRHKAGTPRPLFGGRVLGELEESFIEQLTVGDTFAFAGEVVRFEGLQETEALVSRSSDPEPKVPSYAGGKFPLSTHLAERVRRMLADERQWTALPTPVGEWLGLQAERSVIPDAGEVLVETFPRGNRHFLVVYPFEGRLAHQTLGMLLTRRLHREGASPIGFVANDYALGVWGIGDVAALMDAGRLDLGAAVRRGHAGRRPGGVARRILSDEAHLPRLRRHLRPDRAAPSRPCLPQRQVGPAGDHLVRSHLRRTAQA